MSEAVAAILADHGARITNSEREVVSIGTKLDRLIFFALTTMVGSIGGLLTALAALALQLFHK